MSSNPPRVPKAPPGICPICQGEVQVAATLIFGEVTCQGCDSQLWMVRTSKRSHIMTHADSRRMQQRMVDFVADQLEVDPEQVSGDWIALSELGADSLDTMELVIQLEEELEQWDQQDSL